MPCSFLRGRDERCEPGVQRSPARRRLTGGDRGSEQRVGESQPLAVQLEDPRVERLARAGLAATTPGSASRRGSVVGSATAATTRATSSAAAPRPSRRSRRSSSRVDGSGSGSPGAGVPPRRWSAPASSSAKNGFPADVSQSLSSVGRGNVASSRTCSSSRSAPTLKPATSTVVELVSGRLRASHDGGRRDRQQNARAGCRRDVRGRSPARRRRRVEPLEVVDGEADRPVRDEHVERREEGGRDGALVGPGVRLAEKQGSLERPPLDRRQLRQARRRRPRRGDRSDPRTRTGSRPPTGRLDSDAVAALGRSVDPGQPERGLADSCLDPERHRAREHRRDLEQPVDRSELVLSADELMGYGGHLSVSCAAVAYEFKLPDLGEAAAVSPDRGSLIERLRALEASVFGT